MAANDPIVSGVAGRYASALFELADEDQAISEVEADLGRVQALLDESADLRRVVASPVYDAADQSRAMGAVLAAAGVGPTARNLVQLLARNRRLFVIGDVIKAYGALAARHRGVVRAEVTTAHALSEDQTAALKEALRASVGKDVTLATRIDGSILGGLIVRMGSRMVDSSLRTKLNNLRTVLRQAS